MEKTNKLIAILIVLTMLFAIIPSTGFALSEAVLYVSATAGEDGDGTEASPYTLDAVKRAVMMLVYGGTASKVTVYLRGGTYRFKDGITYSGTNSGKETCPVEYTAYPGEEVIFTNAVRLDSDAFKKVVDTDVLSRIPTKARDRVVAANLYDMGISSLGTMKKNRYMTFDEVSSPILTVNGSMKTLARWPNSGWAFQGEVTNSGTTGNGEFYYTESTGNRWATATDAWYHGFGNYLWADESARATFDTQNKKITLDGTLSYGLIKGRPYYLYNLLEELDSPGEWYLDRNNGIMYIYPDAPLESSEIGFSASTRPVLNISGAMYLTFSGITIEGTCGEGVLISNSSHHNVIKNCVLRNLGKVGVDMNESANNNGISGCHLYNLCKSGVNIREGTSEFKTLTPASNYVENCHIENYGLTSHGYMAAIRVYSIGNRISHNRINGGKHLAIYMNGNENIVEYNDIYNVMNTAEDMAAIYCWSDWTNLGHKLRYNLIHDMPGTTLPGRTHKAHAIYFDDAASNATIYGNVIANVEAGIYTNGGSYHDVQNNIFIKNSAFAANIYNWSSRPDDEIIEANKVLMQSVKDGDATWKGYGDIINHKYRQLYWEQKYPSGKAAYDKKYPWLATFLESDPFIPKHNTVKNNVSIEKNNATYGKAFRIGNLVNTYGSVSNNITFESGLALTDEAGGNYTPKSYDSILASIPDFEQLDVTKTGPEGQNGLSVGEFRLKAPYVSDVTSEAGSIKFSWENSSGADKYRLIVATDSDFSNIVYDAVTNLNSLSVSGLNYAANDYYWKVEAASSSHAYTGRRENKEGAVLLETEPSDFKLVSSSVENGDTDVSWTNSIALYFNKAADSESAENISLVQNGNKINFIITASGSRVLVRHEALTSRNECVLTIPQKVSSINGETLSEEKVIRFTPSSTYSMKIDFTDMEKGDISLHNPQHYGIDLYANHQYNNKTKSKFEIVKESGNKILKFTADGSEGGGYLYARLNHTVENGVVEVNFRYKVDTDPNGTYSLNFFEAQQTGLLTQLNSYFYSGWGTDKTPIENLYGSYGWNTMRYIINIDEGTVSVVSNGQDYGKVSLGTQSAPKEISYLRMGPIFSGLQSGKTLTAYYDDISIRVLDSDLSLVSSSVKNGDTDIPWVNSIELMFDSEVDSSSTAGITLRQGGNAVGAKIVTEGKRVLVRHANLTSAEECTLTIPDTVKATNGCKAEKEEIIKFCPSKTFSMNIDFENMLESDVSSTVRTGYGIDLYANHQYKDKTKSNFRIVEDSGNKVMKFTADGSEGGGYLYAHLNQTHTGGIMEISFRFKIDSDPVGSYSMNFFEAHGAGLLTQQDSYFHTGWGTGKMSVGSLYNNFGWNKMRYIVDMTNKTAALIVNEGTAREAIYENINMGDIYSIPSQIGYLRLGPTFTGLVAGKTLTAYYDDVKVRVLPIPGQIMSFNELDAGGTVTAGSTVNITGGISNGTTKLKSLRIYVALYSGNGKMKVVKAVEIKNVLPKDTAKIDIPLLLPNTVQKNDIIKVFGFDGSNSLSPVCLAEEI